MYHIGGVEAEKKFPTDHNVSVFSVLARCDPLTQFTCNSGRCIDIRQKCDGVEDCADYTDELYCPSYNSSTNESKQTFFIHFFLKKCERSERLKSLKLST